jgi:phosphonate transport system permease protein
MALVAIIALAYRGSEGDFRRLFSRDSRATLIDFALGFWPPAHDPDFLFSMLRPLLETVAIAFLGISVALIFALPLSFLATAPAVTAARGDRTGPVRRISFHAARLLLNGMRSIPELIWALIFVRIFGIGAGAGVWAIGIGYAGVLGKVFAEIFESLPRGAAEGLASGGAPPLRGFTFGVLPAAMPLMGSYALYRFDCALRASAILGIVGAGGVGQQLELSIKMFDYHQVATLILALFVLVSAADSGSQRIRKRLQNSSGLLPVSKAPVWRRTGGLIAWVAAGALAIRFLQIPLSELFSVQALRSAASYVWAMFPPDLEWSFVSNLGPAILETLSISILGTAIAAVLGILLAYPAALKTWSERVSDQPANSPGLFLQRVASWSARGVLNLCRTLPELLWALIFIFVVGLGPFAGALALGVHTAGVLGRLYSEAIEEVSGGPLLAVRSGGATDAATFAFGAWPQAFPQLVAYTLYRWEVNIRASAVLGVVGAGGLGKALYLSLGLFHHHRTLTLIMVIVGLVAGVDLLSSWLRRCAQQAGSSEALSARYSETMEAQLEQNFEGGYR